jgi:RimJ/RimL family protein N-acetyltransferase
MMTKVPGVFLESERLFLRQFTMDDADLLFRLDNDAEVMRYVNGGVPVPLEEIVLDLVWFLSYYERSDGYGFWAAIDKASEQFLGSFHFRPEEGAGPLEPELGYRLHRFAWNQGYATEGSQALVRNGFAELEVERVTAHAMAVNVASRRVMEKVGLRFVRTLRHDWPMRIPGEEHGEVEYVLDRSQWESDHTSE